MAELNDIELSEGNQQTDLSASAVNDDDVELPALVKFIGQYAGLDENGNRVDSQGREVINYKKAMRKSQVMNKPRALKEGNSFKKIEPGEEHEEAAPFPVLMTPVRDLEGFGLGVVMYFNTLIIMAVCMIICFLINVWTYNYFQGEKYSGKFQEDATVAAMFPGDLVGSAFCPQARKHDIILSNFRNATLHDCPFSPTQGWVDLTSSVFLLVVILLLGKAQSEQAEAIDESVQTSQDYSVEVEDPGDTLRDNDPMEWVKFFRQFGDVATLAIAKKNGKLIKLMVERRALLRKVDMEGWDEEEDPDFVPKELRDFLIAGNVYPPESDAEGSKLPALEPIPTWKAVAQKAGLKHDVRYLVDKIGAVNKQIHEELAKLTNQIESKGHVDNARVYVTYNLETEQRKCISALSTGSVFAFLDIPKPQWIVRWFGNEPAPEADTFHGNVLRVTLAPEPSDINWENLDVEPVEVVGEQVLFTGIAVCIIALLSWLVKTISRAEPLAAGFFISGCNAILPTTMKILNSFERHPTNTDSQSSLLFKLVAARWTISAIVVYIITPWTTTIDADKIKGIMSILLADCITTPTLRLLNIGHLVNVYVLSPFAKTQQQLETLLKGAPWLLAERYSDMTKTLYICLFYSAILPTGYLVTACALVYNFWVDKYCLLRTWQVPPMLDASIAANTRSRIAIVVLVHLIVSLHYYAGWPFDNVLCTDPEGNLDHDPMNCNAELNNMYTVTRVNTNVWQSDDFIWFNRRSYMTDGQFDVVLAYQVTSTIAVILISLYYFGQSFVGFLWTLFVGVIADSTDPAVRPESEKDDNAAYLVDESELVNCPKINHEGRERYLIESRSILDTLEAYVAQAQHPQLGVPQLAVYHPEMAAKLPSSKWQGQPQGAPLTDSWFPAEMLSWNENERFDVFFYDNNLFLDPILSSVPEENRKKMFSSFHVIPKATEGATAMSSVTQNPAV